MDKEKVRGLIRQLAQEADIEIVVDDPVRYLPSDSRYERLVKRRAYAWHQVVAGAYPPHLPSSEFTKWSDGLYNDYEKIDIEVRELEKSMKGAGDE